MTGKVYPESARILGEKVSRQGMPVDVPRTWILTLRDRALSAMRADWRTDYQPHRGVGLVAQPLPRA